MIEHLDSFALNFWANVTKGNLDEDCWKWKGGKTKDGYGCVTTHTKEKQFTNKAHRISYALHFGAFNLKLLVLHSCDNPECSNPLHLFLGTYQDNMNDRGKKGRTARLSGEANGSSKLTEEQAAYIYTHRARGNTIILAARFNVDQTLISKIWNKKSWKALTDQIDKSATVDFNLLTREEREALS